MEVLIEAVKTIGISAVFVLLMAYFVKYMFDKFMELINQQNEKHDKEIKELTDVINNNTLAIQKLTDKLENDIIYVEEENV